MSDFEQQIREKLQAAGLIDRMKSLFLDAAMDVVKNDADPSRTDPRLMKPSPLFLQNRDTESFSMSMAMIVDFLRQYGLMHTLNCLKSECGREIFPPETDDETEEEIQEEREALCEDLGLSTEGSILERIYERATKAPPSSSSAPSMTTHSISEMPSKQHQQQQQQQQKVESPVKQQQQQPSETSASTSQSSSAASSPAKSSSQSAGQPSPTKSESQQSTAAATKSNAPPEAKQYPTELIPCTGKNKGAETKYTVEWFEGGEFVRYNQITGQPFVMEYMKNCRIIILDAIDNITMDDCENCEVVVAACENSAFIRTCKDVTLRIACKQLRTRDCENCDIFLYTNTDPVVENSFGMHFYPFNIETPQLCDRFKAARFDPKMNRFVHVYDFTSDAVLGGGQDHFTIHYPDHGNTQIMRYGMGVDEAAIESPPEIKMLLNGEIEPAQSLERGGSKSLNIKTGAKQWQQQQQQQPEEEEKPTGVTRPQSAPASTASSTQQQQQQERPSTAQPATSTSNNNNNKVPPISGIGGGSPTKTAPAAATTENDAFMLKRDSSSDDSSFSSYDDSEFEKDTDEDDDDTF